MIGYGYSDCDILIHFVFWTAEVASCSRIHLIRSSAHRFFLSRSAERRRMSLAGDGITNLETLLILTELSTLGEKLE